VTWGKLNEGIGAAGARAAYDRAIATTDDVRERDALAERAAELSP
jgi:predicted RNA polymerase sigma factor